MDDHIEKRYAQSSESEKKRTLIDYSEARVYESIRLFLTDAQTRAFNAINVAMVQAYWETGREITEAVGDRAEYGKQLLQFLSGRLTVEFGKGFTVANLRNMRQFFQTFPNRYALRSELTWTHYRMLMRIDEPIPSFLRVRRILRI